MDFRLDGYCGLFCGACPVMLGTSVGVEDNPCHGCKSDLMAAGRHCATCGIKACARGRGYEFCYECPDMVNCEQLQKFIADSKWPYHRGVLKNMEMIRREGVSKWLEAQGKRWQCANCGAAHSWWDETCPRCGGAVLNYQADL
ncbi:MAG: DUF3795 domain-containing protein [Anaerolineaceae bacterium]|nr:DUF3795 domain-containing protein [Anaerolineaceae bacterium]